MATNPNKAVGLNAAYSGRISVPTFNDQLAMYGKGGILSGWKAQPYQAMTIQIGGDAGVRDVAIAKSPSGELIAINNISREPIYIDMPTASTDMSRTDAVVAYAMNPPQSNANEADAPSAAGIIAVAGNGDGAPNEETIRKAITADGGGGNTAFYVVLAYVEVPQNATVITDLNQDELDVSIRDDLRTNLLDVREDGEFIIIRAISKNGVKEIRIATKFELVDEEDY